MRPIALVCIAAAVALTSPVGAEPVIPVSPAGGTATTCPTFSWAAPAAAQAQTGDGGYEIAVYRLQDDGELTPEPVLHTQLPAGAQSWTPSTSTCLDPGAKYGWSVRAVDKGYGSWSEPELFEVEALPSDEEVRRAMATLRRHLAGTHVTATGTARTLRAGNLPPGTNVGAGNGQGLPASAVAASPSPQIGAAEKTLANEQVTSKGRRQVRSRFQAKRSVLDPLTSGTVGGDPSPTGFETPDRFSLNLEGDLDLGQLSGIFISGSSFAHSFGRGNTALGHRALVSGTYYDYYNTGIGYMALHNNSTGSDNTALGYLALHTSTTSDGNTAVGSGSLAYNMDGEENTAIGYEALSSNTSGWENVAVGARALDSNTTADFNTAVGHRALHQNTTGTHNTAIGFLAGYGWTTGSRNIAIGYGAFGIAGEIGTIRIGGEFQYYGLQSRTFIAGITGRTTGRSDAVPVLIDSLGQLGTISSSARVKEDIHDLDEASSRLLDLRPVSFRYKKPFENGEKPIQYGLIAEEVAEVFPELVVYNDDGDPETVKYHLLSVLLLEALQDQRDLVTDQRHELEALRSRVEAGTSLRVRIGP